MVTEHIMGERGKKHRLITEVIQAGSFTHRLLLRCWCSGWPLEGRSDPQVCEGNWIKRCKNGKRKIDGNGTKLRIFCCFSLTGSTFNTFKWSLKFQWPWMTFNVWLSGDQLNCKKKTCRLGFDLSTAQSSEDTIIHTFSWMVTDQRSVSLKPSPGFRLLENSEAVYQTGWAWMFKLTANKEPSIP